MRKQNKPFDIHPPCGQCKAELLPLNAATGCCVECTPMPPLPGLHRHGSARSSHPFSRSEAIRLGDPLYASPEPLECGHTVGALVFVEGDSCRRCLSEMFERTSIDTHTTVWHEPGEPIIMHPHVCPKGPHRFATHGDPRGRCLNCPPTRKSDPARVAARNDAAGTYIPTLPCVKCNERAERVTQSNRCYGCQPRRSKGDPARAEARARGVWRYIPTDPCSECNTRTERHTQTGRCYGCRPATGSTKGDGAVAALVTGSPDMIISRDDALACGLPAYRTGEACKHGHRAYRYTSTRNCIGCRS